MNILYFSKGKTDTQRRPAIMKFKLKQIQLRCKNSVQNKNEIETNVCIGCEVLYSNIVASATLTLPCFVSFKLKPVAP